MYRYLLLPVFMALLSCEKTPNFDLSKPIFIVNQMTLPQDKQSLFLEAMKEAILHTKGIVSADKTTLQKIILVNTDEEDCQNPEVRAFVHLPDNFIIHLCTTFSITMPYTLPIAIDTMMHEWGHEVGNRSDHLPCESHSIMTPTPFCHPGQKEYTQNDIEYLCNSGNTIHGICDLVSP